MVETFLCIFNCGRPVAPPPPSASKSTDIHQPYDKMVQESSTHFTLHETTTSRAVTTESIQRQLPSAPPAPSEQQQHQKSGGELRKRQYLVNENYENIGGSGNAPPVKGGQISVPPYHANAPSSNVKHNQNISRISKSASNSNPAQTNSTLDASVVNPQKQHRNGEPGNRNVVSGHKTLEDSLYNSLVQNPQQKQSNSSSRNQQPQYQSWSSKNVGPLDNEEESFETKNPTHKHRSNPRHEPPGDTSKYEHPLSNEASNNPTKGSCVNPTTGKVENEGSAYWSATTGKADLIVHDSSRNVKSDKSSRSKNDVQQNVHKSSSHHPTTKSKDKTDGEYNNPHHHHHQHKHRDHHHTSRNKSAGGGSKNYYDYNSSSNNRNASAVGNNNYNITSANVSDSKYNNSGVNNNVTGDNCNSDHRHRSRTTTHHAVVEPHKRTSRKISSAMVPQHYYLSNTPDIPPPLPSCPPPPLDTPPPTKSNTNQSHFSYNVYNPNPTNFSSTYKSSTSHNYQSNHPSSLDNRNKLNNSVHGDNNTVSSSRSGGQQNKKLQDNEKPISPPLSKHNLSNLKYSDAGSNFSKSNPESSTAAAAGLAPSNVESHENKLSKISTTAVISSESTSSSTVTNLQLDPSTKTSHDTKSAPNKSTGAIPKKKKALESFPVPTTTTAVPGIKPSTTSTKSVTSSTNQNHLDEIVSFPLDDSISSSNVVGLNTSLSNRTNLPHNLMKDSNHPSSSSSYDGGSSSKHMTTKNSQRHYVQ